MRYFYRNEQGVPEEVTPERWQWEVVYQDGTKLQQFEPRPEGGVFHRFDEIVQSQVACFRMIPTDEELRTIEMVVHSGLQLFHFYRNVVLEAGTPQERRERVYVFGWKDRETKATSYNFILPDDTLVTAPADVALTI